MQLPIYKELVIKKADRTVIKKAIASSSIGRAPIVMKIAHLEHEQSSAISIIEEILSENMISPLFPYRVFVLSTIENYRGELCVIRDTKELPKFFLKKEKLLNVKEQNSLNKVRIIQTKLYNSNIPEQLEKVADFAQNHKRLYKLSLEGQFLENLIIKLGV